MLLVFGILQEMGGAPGWTHFGTAGAICAGIGVGVALGVTAVNLRRYLRSTAANDVGRAE